MKLSHAELCFLKHTLDDKFDLTLNYTDPEAVINRYKNGGIDSLMKYPFSGNRTPDEIKEALKLFIRLSKKINKT